MEFFFGARPAEFWLRLTANASPRRHIRGRLRTDCIDVSRNISCIYRDLRDGDGQKWTAMNYAVAGSGPL